MLTHHEFTDKSGRRQDLSGFSLDLSSGTGELRFAAGDPAVEDLEPGEVLVSEPVPGVAPDGFLQKIISVRREGDTIIIETEQANLLDVFEEADIELEQELTGSDVVEATAFYEGMSISYPSAELRPEASGSVGYKFSVDFDEVLIDNEHGSLKIDGAFNFSATASAGIDICKLCGGSFIPRPAVRKVYGKVRLEESVGVTLTGEFKEEFGKSIPVARFKFGTFTIWVGPVPVVFVIDMVISVGADGQFEAHFEAGAVQSTVVQVGIEYTRSNGWRDLNEFKFDFDYSLPEITGAARARAFLRPQLNVKIYGLAGPYLYAEAFIEADAEMYRNPFWEFYGGIDFGIGFTIDLPIVGNVASYDKELLGFREPLARAPNEPPRIEVSPRDGHRIVTGQDLILTVYATDREQEQIDVVFRDENRNELLETKTAEGARKGRLSFDVGCLEPGAYRYSFSATDNGNLTTTVNWNVVVEDQIPIVDIRNISEDTVVSPGWGFPLSAYAQDKSCADRDNAADQALIAWEVAGVQVGSGEIYFHEVPPGYTDDTITFTVSYDDGITVATDELTVPVGDPPADRSPHDPAARIIRPAEDEFFEAVAHHIIPLEAYAYRPAVRGELTDGVDYLWEYRPEGSSSWTRISDLKTDLIDSATLVNRTGPVELRLTVTDDDGKTGSTITTIFIGVTG